MTHLLGIDIGTSGTKTILVDENGGVVARAVAEYPLSTPRPQWSEQDPEDWWNAVCATTRSVLEQGRVRPEEVRAVGFSGQMHGSVFLDADNAVIRPCILWNDQRTQAECAWITGQVGQGRIVDLISNPVLPGFTAGKIVWLRNAEPENYARVRKVLLPKDFIRFRLTGEFATDVSDASGTALFDVRHRTWSSEMLAACGIPAEWLPPAVESPAICSHVSAAGAAATGLAVGTPVVGGAGDQAAGAVGTGIVETGIVSSSIGTSGVVFAFSDQPWTDPQLRLHTMCHAVPGAWHLMGVLLSAGGSLQWYRDTFCGAERMVAAATGQDPYELICSEAAQAPPGCEGLFFLPYLTGERTPIPGPNGRGVLFGLTRRTGRPAVARAVLEGVAFGLAEAFSVMRELGVPLQQVRATGGGARSALWRSIQADVTGLAHGALAVDEGPALGAAILAGVGGGVFASVEAACRAIVRVADSVEPDPDNHRVYANLQAVYRSVAAKVTPDFDALASLTA